MTKIAMHQSQYIPWPPYFKKMALADIFVIMDNVQFQKNGVQNRNKIRNKDGAFWLTIPVTGHLHDSILEKRISGEKWAEKHRRSLENTYSNAPFWDLYSRDIENLYKEKYLTIGEVNQGFLIYLIRRLNIKTKIIRLSELETNSTKSGLVLEICKSLGATVYISGFGGKDYLKEDTFREAGIDIDYIESVAPVYPQHYGGFIPGLSILDMMFNVSVSDITRYFSEK